MSNFFSFFKSLIDNFFSFFKSSKVQEPKTITTEHVKDVNIDTIKNSNTFTATSPSTSPTASLLSSIAAMPTKETFITMDSNCNNDLNKLMLYVILGILLYIYAKRSKLL